MYTIYLNSLSNFLDDCPNLRKLKSIKSENKKINRHTNIPSLDTNEIETRTKHE